MKSLWWFYENLPLCKALPNNLELIRERCPAIIREKVIDLMSIVNNNETIAFTSTNPTHRQTMYKGGSGRILRKAFASFGPNSKSFDETFDKNDTNNNKGFRRSTSTVCLNALRTAHTRLMVAREA